MSRTYPSSTRCAACKCLRRKCPPDCILAPHFPPSNPHRFVSVHKVFGAANITKMLEQVPVHLRGQAADCMIFEANTRMRDPMYGSVGMISQLQQQITQVQKELLKIHGEIAFHHAQTMQQVQNGENENWYGPEVGPKIFNRLSGGKEVGSSNGQLFEIDLDGMYANFNG